MITIKLNKLIECYRGLKILASTRDLPISVSYRLSKMIKQIDSEYEIFEEKRKQMIEKYCTLNEDGTAYNPNSNEDAKKLDEEYAELMNLEVEINADKINIDSGIYDVLGINGLSALDLINLESFIGDYDD